MIPKELAKQIRYIQMVTNRAVNTSLAGEYSSVFKGRGMEFDEVREYQPGDEIRTIDWNVTARTGHPFVKRYVEERELTVLFAVDISASGSFGSAVKKKSEVAAELCALLAFSAIKNNDKVGLLLFSEDIELFIPPGKGVAYVLRIIREVLYYKPRHRGTDIAQALEFMARVMRRRGVIFLISDFLAPDFTRPLGLMARKHDMIAISVNDRREFELPALGLVELADAESGKTVLVDTSDRRFQAQYKQDARLRQEKLAHLLAARSVDHIPIVLRGGQKKNRASYVDDLVRFFKRREQRQR
ncbi:MAG: DUF58 domain-containing protein [Deltaproteobacteria bacterium]|nr:DUF58 domain-containing protein [Deltaproteobacteria bacterium]